MSPSDVALLSPAYLKLSRGDESRMARAIYRPSGRGRMLTNEQELVGQSAIFVADSIVLMSHTGTRLVLLPWVLTDTVSV